MARRRVPAASPARVDPAGEARPWTPRARPGARSRAPGRTARPAPVDDKTRAPARRRLTRSPSSPSPAWWRSRRSWSPRARGPADRSRSMAGPRPRRPGGFRRSRRGGRDRAAPGSVVVVEIVGAVQRPASSGCPSEPGSGTSSTPRAGSGRGSMPTAPDAEPRGRPQGRRPGARAVARRRRPRGGAGGESGASRRDAVPARRRRASTSTVPTARSSRRSPGSGR